MQLYCILTQFCLLSISFWVQNWHLFFVSEVWISSIQFTVTGQIGKKTPRIIVKKHNDFNNGVVAVSTTVIKK